MLCTRKLRGPKRNSEQQSLVSDLIAWPSTLYVYRASGKILLLFFIRLHYTLICVLILRRGTLLLCFHCYWFLDVTRDFRYGSR